MPIIKVGNVKFNLESIKSELLNAKAMGIKFAVFPELCFTGNSLQNLYLDNNILNESLSALFDLVNFSNEYDMIIIVSIPYKHLNNVYEVACVIKTGKILGFVPKHDFNINDLNYKYFCKNTINVNNITLIDPIHNIKYDIPFSDKLIFDNGAFNYSIGFDNNLKNTAIAVNIASIPETIYIDDKLKEIKKLSKDNNNVIITSTPGPTESSSNFVYFGRSTIAECGDLIAKNDILNNTLLFCDVDLDKATAHKDALEDDNNIVSFAFDNYSDGLTEDKLYRELDKTPYINKKVNAYNFSMHIINILAIALAKRLKAVKSQDVVLGVSGGLDSTIALLVIKKCMEYMSLTSDNIHAYSLPGFGTTSNSNNNIKNLLTSLNITLNEINISNAVTSHFMDITHDASNTNVTFENAQARERMQILMDIANDLNAIVVGTSDLSEIALGFSTYNGDHMSMYNINGSLPKTLIKYILNAIAQENKNNNKLLSDTINTILSTPISPELMPTENGILRQKTEDILGNYEIHDFVLYYYLKYHFDIKKLYDLTLRTFVYNDLEHKYSNEYIKNCINMFFKRFYSSQYKRSTAPDSPSIGLPSLNKNFDFNIPTDVEINIEL